MARNSIHLSAVVIQTGKTQIYMTEYDLFICDYLANLRHQRSIAWHGIARRKR